MFVYVCFLVRYYYVECTDFMYDSIKILYIYIYIFSKNMYIFYLLLWHIKINY